MPEKDKVKFGIKNVHFHPILSEAAGVPTYGAPIAIPGTTALSMDAQSSISKFYADNMIYYQTSSNNGYEGDLTVALIPEEVMTQILNYAKDNKKVITEKSTAVPKAFAMTFEEEGDVSGTRFVLYNCTLTKPSRSFATTEEERTPTTQTLKISAAPLKDGNVMSMTTEETDASVVSSWHDAVYQYAEASQPSG